MSKRTSLLRKSGVVLLALAGAKLSGCSVEAGDLPGDGSVLQARSSSVPIIQVDHSPSDPGGIPGNSCLPSAVAPW